MTDYTIFQQNYFLVSSPPQHKHILTFKGCIVSLIPLMLTLTKGLLLANEWWADTPIYQSIS